MSPHEQQRSAFLMYRAAGDEVAVHALVKDETIWLSQKAMAEWFDVQPPSISKHLKNIFVEEELQEEAVVFKNAFYSIAYSIFRALNLLICGVNCGTAVSRNKFCQ